ncbi:MAG: hypothetical protein LBC86_05960 [Oscillospiraceae bacterium]|jgi:hypothetical protein|nr:hypothetical protein [Oscillospiraceae bacterium]
MSAVLFVPKLLLKLTLLIIGGVLYVVTFAFTIIAALSSCVTNIIGTLLIMGGVLGGVLSLYRYSQDGATLQENIFMVLAILFLIAIGVILLFLPVIGAHLTKIPLFIFEQAGKISLTIEKKVKPGVVSYKALLRDTQRNSSLPVRIEAVDLFLEARARAEKEILEEQKYGSNYIDRLVNKERERQRKAERSRKRNETARDEIIERKQQKDNAMVPESKPKQGGNFNEENLIHTTVRKEKVRSKSEVIIANALHYNNIEYKYEGGIFLKGKLYRPDFVIKHGGKQFKNRRKCHEV